MKESVFRVSLLVFSGVAVYLFFSYSTFSKKGFIAQYSLIHSVEEPLETDVFFGELAKQAELRTLADVRYDGRYIKIKFPMGDVPENIGVCTDVIIRAYRALGIDLQVEVNSDMSANFMSYPKMWRLLKPDTNIDHRRVPNLMTFFNRMGASLPITNNPSDYVAGDIVAWDLGGDMMHIGIVSSQKSPVSDNLLIAHNIGSGPKLDDLLFGYKIIGHYRYSNKDRLTME